MKIKKLETKKERFNRINMRRAWSTALHIKLVMQNRRSWKDGLTSKDLLKKVKASLRDNKKNKKAKKIKMCTIYVAISKINLYHEPPFYISSEGRMKSNGKYEHRYFVPYTQEDIEKERGKQIRLGTLKFTKEKNVREFGDEIEMEQPQKQLQEIKMKGAA